MKDARSRSRSAAVFGCCLVVAMTWGVFPFGTVLTGLNPGAFTSGDIGGPEIAGSLAADANAVRIIAGGKGTGFRSDQFFFAAAPEAGDFDVRVRVAALKNTDLWAKAGLMLRANRSPGAPFAAVWATPTGAGCLFQNRSTADTAAVNQGFFPANLPFAWLRLSREGEMLTGYAGYDGRRWTVLGSKSIALGTEPLLGLAVTSHSATPTLAEFRDWGPAEAAVVGTQKVPMEPLGPSSRRTSLVLSEIMYHPAERSDGKQLEYVELYNSQPYYEDISGWKLSGDIEFVFPAGTVVSGGGLVVVAGAPADVREVYGLDNVLGPFAGKLDNAGGTLRLIGDRNAVLLDVEFNDRAPWPVLADGAGHSLALVRPSYGEADPRAWAASRVKGGSPGMPEAAEPTSTAGVCLNECQLPDSTGNGFVELFNRGATEADLGGLRLGPAPDDLPFTIPAGTRLTAGGLVQFTWSALGFRLETTGGVLYLESADHSRFLDAAVFGPQAPGTSAGRWPNGNTAFRVLSSPTPGTANLRPQTGVVINEIHHSPISGDSAEEFIELLNTGSIAVDLSFWEFESGVSFVFPQDTRMPAGDYLVIAHNADRFKQLHPNLSPEKIVGDFSGKLRGRSEHVVLSRPVTVRTASGQNKTVLAHVSEASYYGSGRWHLWSDNGGSTLELVDSRADANQSSNWADSDESKGGTWTTVEFTGVLDNGPAGGGGFPGGGGGPGGGGRPGGGAIAPDSLHIILLGEGECLIDNVEVIGPGNTNRIANGTFENGPTGWTFSGNHIRSSLETTEGDQSSQSLHLRASGNGDTGANKIYVKLTQALATNSTATLRARVKWLRGWPEILLRLHGNYLEAYGRLDPPTAPGTPGAKNSRALDNTGPALGDVTHFPAVPAVDEPVVVTAFVDDPDGVDSVALICRVDPDTSQNRVAMHDDGTEGDEVPGDGIYAGVIPAPGAAKLVAFTVEAQDGHASPATTVFPPGGTGRECLVRFGEGIQSGAFGTYRLWVTQANSAAWKNRPVMSNEPIESTFVYGNSRVVYNAGGRFAGSPYHQQFPDGPASTAHFVIEFPKEDRILGAPALNKLHAPGNGAFDDNTLQREQVVYWLARKSGLPWLHRRFFHFYVNGAKKQNLMEDTQVGSDDLVAEFWPDNTEGNLYKMQPWFEFADATTQTLNMQNSSFVSISRFVTTGNQLKLARYRWNWLVRGAETTANDYTNLLQLVTVATDTNHPNYEANVEALVDVDQWLSAFAINHAVGNWDSVGYRNAQNTYSYKPREGRWELVIWDANIALGNAMCDGPANLPLLTTSDPTLTRWFSRGNFKRRFLTAYHELVNGPMQTSLIAPLLDAKYAAFQDHGITASSPEGVKTWITSARNYILSQINKDSATFAVTNLAGSDALTLAGTGPLNMVSLWINETPVDVTWTSTKTWSATFASGTPTNRLTVSALNRDGNPIAGAEQVILLNNPSAAVTLNREGNVLVFDYPASRDGPYQLQATESLVSPAWLTIASQSPADGVIQFRIPTPASSVVFYRVVAPSNP